MAKKKLPTTQLQIDVAEIRDGVIVMKDGTMRGVLLCSSVNFALKSSDEQQAIVGAYVSFLNSMDFPIQICIQSRKLNIDGYLNELKARAKVETNDLLKIQIADYMQFVKELVDLGDIMTKRFYIIVPYNSLSDKRKGFMQRTTEVFRPAASIALSQKVFGQRSADLERRMEKVASAIGGVGITSARLDTQGIIELLYSTYNPDVADVQPIGPVEQLRVDENYGF